MSHVEDSISRRDMGSEVLADQGGLSTLLTNERAQLALRAAQSRRELQEQYQYKAVA